MLFWSMVEVVNIVLGGGGVIISRLSAQIPTTLVSKVVNMNEEGAGNWVNQMRLSL